MPADLAQISPRVRTLRRRFVLLLSLLTLLVGCWSLSTPAGRSPERIGGDANDYQGLALNLADRGTYSLAFDPPYGPSVFRSPGYPLFLAAVYRVVGRSVWTVRVLQLALHGLTAWLLFLVGERLVGRRAAAVGAILTLTYIPLIWYTNYHLSETLGVLLTVLLIELGLRFAGNPRRPLLLAAGVGFVAGFLALTRPALAPLLVIPLGILWLSKQTPRRRAELSAVVLAALLTTLSPWLYYTKQASGSMHLSLSGITLLNSALQYTGEFSYQGLQEDWNLYFRLCAQGMEDARKRVDPASPISPTVQAELSADREWRREAFRLFRQVGPVGILKRAPAGTFWLWSTGSGISRGIARRLAQVQWLVLAALVGLGAWLSRARWRQLWLIGFATVYITFIHLVFHIEPRYSFPGRPLLLLLAGVGACWLWDRCSPRLRRKSFAPSEAAA